MKTGRKIEKKPVYHIVLVDMLKNMGLSRVGRLTKDKISSVSATDKAVDGLKTKHGERPNRQVGDEREKMIAKCSRYYGRGENKIPQIVINAVDDG